MLNNIKKLLEIHKNEIISILEEIESENVAIEEYNLSILALENNKYIGKNVSKISSFLPMNLPLFSLVVYVIVPKVCSETSIYRPSTLIKEQVQKIHNILKLDNFNINLFIGTREKFVRDHVSNSNVVVFVGKPENADNILSKINNNILFIYFGVGQNPVIIADNANIELACEKITNTIMFNYGQDCGKPNVILCKRPLYENFLEKLKEKILAKEDCKVMIRNIKSLSNVSEFLLKESNNIVMGGTIDLKNKTLEPVIISKPLCIDKDTYSEFYAPIFRIMIYENISDLKKYFSEQQYKDENMNISVFGNCNYVETLSSSLILHEEMVPEIDNGYCEFGGYGKNTSYIQYKGIRINKPILINREIDNFYDNQKFTSNEMRNIEKYSNQNKLKKVLYLEYKDMIKKIFSDNLYFSFIFGSYAKFRQKISSDLDMFICMLKEETQIVNQFREWYFKFHYMYGLTPDFYYPGEILTKDKLEYIIKTNKNAIFNLKNSSELFDAIFYTQIFTDKKVMQCGNTSELINYEKRFEEFVPEFCHQIFELLTSNNIITSEREYTKCLFALANNDLLFFAKKIDFETTDTKQYDAILNKLDDGFLNKCLRKKKY